MIARILLLLGLLGPSFLCLSVCLVSWLRLLAFHRTDGQTVGWYVLQPTIALTASDFAPSGVADLRRFRLGVAGFLGFTAIAAVAAAFVLR